MFARICELEGLDFLYWVNSTLIWMYWTWWRYIYFQYTYEDSNPEPLDCQTEALSTELSVLTVFTLILIVFDMLGGCYIIVKNI